jgi:hypothetical protein
VVKEQQGYWRVGIMEQWIKERVFFFGHLPIFQYSIIPLLK